jgi:hypothetical protein
MQKNLLLALSIGVLFALPACCLKKKKKQTETVNKVEVVTTRSTEQVPAKF